MTFKTDNSTIRQALQCLSLEGLLSDGGHETGNLILRSLLKGR